MQSLNREYANNPTCTVSVAFALDSCRSPTHCNNVLKESLQCFGNLFAQEQHFFRFDVMLDKSKGLQKCFRIIAYFGFSCVLCHDFAATQTNKDFETFLFVYCGLL